MAYWDNIYRLGIEKVDFIEHEISFAGNYGRKGEKRLPRKKKTPYEMKIQNALNKANRIRRLIRANFKVDDLWVTLTLEKKNRKSFSEIKGYFQKTFLKEMRKDYKKLGEPFKFIYLMEVGERGGMHIHLVLNRARGKPTDIMLSEH